MAFDFIVNNVQSSLDGAINDLVTTIKVHDGAAPYVDFPAPTAGNVCVATITDSQYNPTLIEIITYTGVTNDAGSHDLTGVTRAQEATTNLAWLDGAFIFQGVTKEALRNLVFDDIKVLGAITEIGQGIVTAAALAFVDGTGLYQTTTGAMSITDGTTELARFENSTTALFLLTGHLDMGGGNLLDPGTGHDAFTDFESDEHVPHLNVNIVAGTGLTGGGTIAATRTLNVIGATSGGILVNANDLQLNINNLATATIVDGDFIPFDDLSSALDKKITFANFEATLEHDKLAGSVSDEHFNHTTISVTAGTGLTGGGTIAATRTLNVIGATSGGILVNANDLQLNINNLATATIVDGDFIPFDDLSSALDKKITFANLEATLEHDKLAGFVGNEHFNHTTISVTAGDGLSGGGTIAATRTINVDSTVIRASGAVAMTGKLQVADGTSSAVSIRNSNANTGLNLSASTVEIVSAGAVMSWNTSVGLNLGNRDIRDIDTLYLNGATFPLIVANTTTSLRLSASVSDKLEVTTGGVILDMNLAGLLSLRQDTIEHWFFSSTIFDCKGNIVDNVDMSGGLRFDAQFTNHTMAADDYIPFGNSSDANNPMVWANQDAITAWVQCTRVLAKGSVGSLINNDPAEITLFSYSVPANTMGLNGTLRMTIHGQCGGDGGVFRIRFKFGGTEIYSDDVLIVTTSNRGCEIVFTIGNTNNASIQRGGGHILLSGPANTTTGVGDLVAAPLSATGLTVLSTTKATSSAQTMEITGDFSASTNLFFVQYSMLEFLPGPI